MVLSDIEVCLSTKRVSKLSLVESNARKSINSRFIRDLREEYVPPDWAEHQVGSLHSVTNKREAIVFTSLRSIHEA